MAKRVIIKTPGERIPSMQTNNYSDFKSVQEYNKSQIYFKGFQKNVAVGSNVLDLQLGGSARRMFGLIFIVSGAGTDDDLVSLTINNEQIIIDTHWRAFSPNQTGNPKDLMYFPIPRPLSGSDSVALNWFAINAKVVYPVFYLSNFPGEPM